MTGAEFLQVASPAAGTTCPEPPRPMPGGRGWQPAGCTRNGCAARKSLEVCRLPRSELCPAQDGFSAVSNDEFCPVLNTTNSLVWLRKVCGCAYYTATRRQKWAARVWLIALVIRAYYLLSPLICSTARPPGAGSKSKFARKDRRNHKAWERLEAGLQQCPWRR